MERLRAVLHVGVDDVCVQNVFAECPSKEKLCARFSGRDVCVNDVRVPNVHVCDAKVQNVFKCQSECRMSLSSVPEYVMSKCGVSVCCISVSLCIMYLCGLLVLDVRLLHDCVPDVRLQDVCLPDLCVLNA